MTLRCCHPRTGERSCRWADSTPVTRDMAWRCWWKRSRRVWPVTAAPIPRSRWGPASSCRFWIRRHSAAATHSAARWDGWRKPAWTTRRAKVSTASACPGRTASCAPGTAIARRRRAGTVDPAGAVSVGGKIPRRLARGLVSPQQMLQDCDRSSSAWNSDSTRFSLKPILRETRCMATLSERMVATMRLSFSSRPICTRRRNSSPPNPCP